MTDDDVFHAAVEAKDWPLAAMTILAQKQSTKLTRAVFINDLWRLAFFNEQPDDVETFVPRAWRIVKAMEDVR